MLFALLCVFVLPAVSDWGFGGGAFVVIVRGGLFVFDLRVLVLSAAFESICSFVSYAFGLCLGTFVDVFRVVVVFVCSSCPRVLLSGHCDID